ncbi:mucolipin-1-like [Ruditapes philippinarum]|uniref:mucolipin-1-like n=1 Tax=Ruditapes philippinarum TaxID=129788 RepID=UPI00295BBB04|nr:mucolipin-1-like [Ruditapes philippinarum]
MLKGELSGEEVLLKNWDVNLVVLGLGCLLTWFSYARFIRIHNKFTLLVKTIRKAAVDIVFFLTCVVLMFVGFWSCSYIVLGPYHIKFRKMSTAAETLFSMSQGDEIFATFAILQDEYAGDKTVHFVSKSGYLRLRVFVLLF